MLEDYSHRFKLLVDTLMSHPQVRVTHVWIGPPASDEALAKLEQAWGRVPGVLATLYRQADGIQLRWIDSAGETYHPARDDAMQFQGSWRSFEEPGEEVGLLDVPTIEELLGRDIVGEMFDMQDDPLCGAVAFDSFGESQDAVLYFEDAPDDPWVGVSSDYLADVPPPGQRTLSQYLEHVLSTWASIDCRGGEGGPKKLDELLRRRVPLDPTRLVGQRIVYMESSPGHTLMHGRVSSLIDIADPPNSWWFAPTVAEVESDLGETVYVPLRALYPPDDADGYERLRADPGGLRSCLEGPAIPMFEDLAPVAEMTHGLGVVDGPSIFNHAWSYVGLTTALDPRDAARLLFGAAQTLYEDRDVFQDRAVSWPATRPRKPHRSTVHLSTLAVGLFDAAVVHMARTGPPDLATWLGPRATARLRKTLDGFRARNRLRGYDPLTDASKTPGFVASALRGGPTTFNTDASAIDRGGALGLADFRVVRS